MELRHQHKNERGVADEEKTRREPELEPPRWPGKRTKTQGAEYAEVDARTPDLRRIRAALGSLRGGGQALPGEMTAQYSQLLGLDLSDVRIHRGQAAKSLEATAFTAGTNIAVAEHLDLDSAFGRHVIAHELVHVAQNKRSGAPMDLAAHMEVGPSGSAVEQEAERGAAALTRGESFTVQAHGRLPGISRFGDDETPPPGAGSAPTTLSNTSPAPVKPDNTPTPTTQPTTATPAPPPATPAPPTNAAPTAQPRPSDQPANTPQAPATPAVGTPGHNQPSGSAPATNPTTLPNKEPRPTATPQAPAPAGTLDARVQQELETRADPTLKAGYARAVGGVDSLRIQALQYSFTPNGVWNTLVETFTAKNAFQDHFGQIYSTNAYRGGKSWADTAQAWIEGLRGVVHIIGDVASVVSAWAGMAALVTGALALILSETVIGGIALGAIAAIAAEIAMVAGAIKLLTDIIDMLLGIIQMIILIVRARNSKDPGERAKFAALLHKEANDFGANVVSIGVQVAVMAVSAGIGAGMSRGANSFMSAFKDEFSKMITPALKPWTLGNNFRNIAKMMAPVAPGSGVAARGNNLLGQQTGRTVLQVEVDQGLVGINRNLRVGGRITRAREVVPFTTRNQMNGARLVTMRQAVSRAMTVNTAGVKIGLGSSQLQADIKQPRASGGGTSGSSPAGTGGRIDAASKPAGADLSKVQMWPSQIEAFQNAKGPLSGAVDRTQRQYDMAESQAGPELSAQVRQAMQGATNNAGQMRFGATQVQTDAREGQANSQRGITQATQANDQKTRMGATQNTANASVQRIQGQGGKLQSPPPKEGVLGWLYNQTIGRIGGWIGSAQKWVMNLVGKWAMSLAGFSKEEMDIAGIENDMRADDKKDATSTQEAQDAALKADQVQQTVFQLQENKTRDEQYAIQAMADAQRFIASLEDADKQLGAAITNGQSYIAAVTPVIAHEMQTEQAGSAIDAQYVAPLVAYATAFGDSIDGSNIGSSANTDGTAALSQMKAAYPELDIGPGTVAIGTAVSQYDTAFGQLAGQARGQVAAAQTAIQAFIGTQDYDGASGNAAALDALAADFDRAAQALADQLYAGINGVITQYNGHIQRAIDEANQVPADQVDPATAPPPPADAPSDDPPPADDGRGFASGYANERAGVAPNPTVMSETKAPVADNAAKPATSDAAMAEKAATPPAEPAVAPEKADASGTKPAPNDGTPAKDDVAKAGAVDAKPKSDAPGAPATAKPIGTPKAQANKADADKSDADKLDLGAAPMSNDAGGGDSGSEPSKPQPKTGARSASTKPQETPIEQPITNAVAETSNAGAKPKVEKPEKTEKKPPNRKSDTGGGQATSGSVAPVQQDDDEADDSEAEGNDSELGDAQGYGTGDAESGYAAGEGQPGDTGTPAERANGGTNAGSVTHQTEVADTRAADRTDVGVGERVQFTADQAGAWSASVSGPGGRATAANAATYTWTAPATATSATVSFTPSGGTAQTFSFTVIAPTGVEFESPQEKSYADGTQGAGMITNVRFQPATVSFHRTKWKEIAGPASGKSGYFENRRVRDHAPNTQWLRIGSDNGGPTDDAYFTGWPSPWTEGAFDYVIPNHYLVDGETGAGHFITDITQAHAMQGDGTSTITKGTASATRSPGTAPPRRGGRGRTGGFGSERGSSNENEGGGDDDDLFGLAHVPWNSVPGLCQQVRAAKDAAAGEGKAKALGLTYGSTIKPKDHPAGAQYLTYLLVAYNDFVSGKQPRYDFYALIGWIPEPHRSAVRNTVAKRQAPKPTPKKEAPPTITPAVKKPRPAPTGLGLSTAKPPKPSAIDWLINPNGAEYSTGGFPTASKKPLNRGGTPTKPNLKLEPTPELDRWIDTLELMITAIPGSRLKAPLETTKATLEVFRVKEQKGEPHNNAKLIFSLGEGVIGTIAEIIKLFARDAALAGKAAEQFGKFAGVLGVIAKVAALPELLSRAIDGKTLTGTPIDTNAQWDAWVDLIGLVPGIGTAISITKTAFMNIVNGIGVPTKDAITERGLKNLFPGTTPEKLKAEIQAMPTDPAVAYGTLDKLWDRTFKPTTGFSLKFNLADAWRKYLLESLGNYQSEFKDVQTRKADDIVRERMAEHYKATAIRFIDKQVREANQWDGTLIQR